MYLGGMAPFASPRLSIMPLSAKPKWIPASVDEKEKKEKKKEQNLRHGHGVHWVDQF